MPMPRLPRTPRRLPGSRRTAAAAGIALGVAALAGCATESPYTSLGDSYVSGPLIPNQSLAPIGCLRSDHNYAHLTAGALNLRLTDVSCSGATTADMGSPQSVTLGSNPAQLSAVTSATKVVTLGIGGNDIGFITVIENCVALTAGGPTRVGHTCKGYYAPAGKPDRLAASIAATAPKVASVLQRIHAKAPSAKVFVVGYPAILPSSGSGCYPQMPLTTTDVGYLRTVEQGLNTMLRETATANAARYVDTYGPSERFNACTSLLTRWVEPVVPALVNPAAPVHPNARGEAGMSGAVRAAMTAAGVS